MASPDHTPVFDDEEDEDLEFKNDDDNHDTDNDDNHNHGRPPRKRHRSSDLPPRLLPSPPPLTTNNSLSNTLTSIPTIPSHSNTNNTSSMPVPNTNTSSPSNSTASTSSKQRVFNTYPQYLKIITKLHKRVGPQTSASFRWDENDPPNPLRHGTVHCIHCSSNGSYCGFWSILKPIKNYTTFKFLCHVKSERHKKSAPREAVIEIERFEQNCESRLQRMEQSKFMRFLNRIHFILYFVKQTYTLCGIHDITAFISSIGAQIEDSNYQNHSGVMDIVHAMCATQEQDDYGQLRQMADGLGYWLSLDGQKRNGKNCKIFGARGIMAGSYEAKEIYLDLLCMNKNSTEYAAKDLLSINSGEDQLQLVDQIVTKSGRPYSRIVGITGDGESAIHGAEKGLIALVSLDRNPEVRGLKALCHRVNYLICAPFKKWDVLQKHLDMVSGLADLLNDSIPSQILNYIQQIDDVKTNKVPKAYTARWNYMVRPLESMATNINQILKSLMYMKDHRKTDKEKQTAFKQWKYWKDLNTLIRNDVATAYAIRADKLVSNLSKRHIDRLSAYSYLYDYIDEIYRLRRVGVAHNDEFIKHRMSQFKRRQCTDENKEHLEKVSIGQFEWTLDTNQQTLSDTYNQVSIDMTGKILDEYTARFTHFERTFYRHLRKAVDPKEFSGFRSFSQVQNYGNHFIERCMRAREKLRNVHGEPIYKYKQNLVIAQYEMSKTILWKYRKVRFIEVRIGNYFAELLECQHLYRDLVMFLTPDILANPVTVELERNFSMRSSIDTTRRQRLSFQTVNELMRIKKNAPDPNLESRELRLFLVHSAYKWYTAKNRNMTFEFLDEVKTKVSDHEQQQAIEDLLDVMWS